MSRAKTERSLENLRALSTEKNCEADNYIEELRKISGEIDDKKTRRNSNFFKALGDENRLKILYLLSRKDMCVCEMVAALNGTQPTVSHHCKILESVGLIEHRRNGKWVFYSLADPSVSEYIENTPV